jgi:hypothetical protein
MPATISYPPPPTIDFGVSRDTEKAEKELNDLLDRCEGCSNRSDILARFAVEKWSNGGASHPGPSTYDFRSPNGLRPHFSIRETQNRLTMTISSQPKG